MVLIYGHQLLLVWVTLCHPLNESMDIGFTFLGRYYHIVFLFDFCSITTIYKISPISFCNLRIIWVIYKKESGWTFFNDYNTKYSNSKFFLNVSPIAPRSGTERLRFTHVVTHNAATKLEHYFCDVQNVLFYSFFFWRQRIAEPSPQSCERFRGFYVQSGFELQTM